MTILLHKVQRAKHVYIFGNGGSYANAVHICNDLLGVGKPAFVLDPATLTAFANDFGYEGVFARWLSVVGNKGDLALALSGSGKSSNIEAALREATRKGMETHLVTDRLQSLDMQASEEAQLAAGHALWRALK